MHRSHPTCVLTPPRPRALVFAFTLVLALLPGATGLAQNASPGPDVAPKGEHQGGPGIPGERVVDLGDAPDYAPMRRVVTTTADGELERFEPVGNPYVLSFVGGDFTPPRGVDPRMTRAAALDPNGHTFGYVMIRGRLNDPRKVERLESLGLELYDPHTWQSTSAKIPFRALPALRELPFVHWVGYALPHQKIHPVLAQTLTDASPDDRFVIHVSTFASDVCADSQTVWSTPEPTLDQTRVSAATATTIPNGPYQRGLERLGFAFHHYNDVMNVHIFEGEATRAVIERIRDLDWVAFVELKQAHRAFHDQTMSMVGLDFVRQFYKGQSVPAGIIDSGIDTTPLHQDLSGKGYLGWSTTPESVWQDGDGHGTHVAGTVLGRGIADARYRGGCPTMGNGGDGFRVYIGRYLNDNKKGQGNVNVLYQRMAADFTFNNVLNKRPRVVNCSWGTPSTTTLWSGTESGARLVDPYAYNGQLYVFAAGNSGRGVGSPASAKNALTVAATTDHGTAAGQTASFSRSGVSDGRQKPEVAAPGHTVTSCDINTTTGYARKVGTSMAAPHVTAAVSGLVEHYSFLDYRPWSQQAVALACAEVQGRKNVDPTQGWGLINARKMHYTGVTRWWVRSGTLNQSGDWFYTDIAIPANATKIVPTLVWLEPAASAGAAAARRSRVSFYLDNTRNNVGNFGQNNRGSTKDNKIWASYSGASLTKYLGRTVRFKVFGSTVNGACKAALCVLVYRNTTSTSPEPSLAVTVSRTKVRPGDTIEVEGAWTRGTGGDHLENGWITLTNTSFTPTRLEVPVGDNVNTYTQSSFPSSPYPSFTNGVVVGQGNAKRARWTLRAPNFNATFAVGVQGTADHTTTGTVTRTVSVCVDGQAPTRPTALNSSTHKPGVWTNRQNYTVDWTASSDVGCAGLQGYGQNIATTAGSTSTLNLGRVTTHSTAFPQTSGQGFYFNLLAIDAVGNTSSVATAGPYLIDTIAPMNPTIRIANSAAITRSLIVTLTNLSATERANGSGVSEMRFSNDGLAWSPWEPFAATRAAWDLSAFGGTTSVGVKRTYAQYRDRAGNLSTRPFDTITFDPIDITTITPTQGPLIGDEVVTITGDGFVAGQTTVSFGGASATSVTVVNATTLTCRTPANLGGGSVQVQVQRSGYGASLPNAYVYRRAAVVASGNPRLGITFPVTFDAPTDASFGYLGAASFGQGPIPLDPHNALRLSPDDLFFLTAENRIPTVFAAIQGTLNAAGQSTCQVTLPNVPVALGASFYMAFVTLDPTKPLGIRSVSTNRRFTIQP